MAEAETNKALVESQAKLRSGKELNALLANRDAAAFETLLRNYAGSAAAGDALTADIAKVKELYINREKPRDFYQAFYGFIANYSADAAVKNRFAVAAEIIQPDEAKRAAAYEKYRKDPTTKQYAEDARKSAGELWLPTLTEDVDTIGQKMVDAFNQGKEDAAKKTLPQLKQMYDRALGYFKDAKGAIVTKLSSATAGAPDRQAEADSVSKFIAGGDAPANQEQSNGQGTGAATSGQQSGTDSGIGWGKILAGIVGLVAAFFGSSMLGGLVGDGLMGMLFKGALMIGLPFMFATQFGGFFDGLLGKTSTGGGTPKAQGNGPARTQAQGAGVAPEQITADKITQMQKQAKEVGADPNTLVLTPEAGGSYHLSMDKNPDGIPNAIKIAVTDIQKIMQASGATAVRLKPENGTLVPYVAGAALAGVGAANAR